MHDEHATPHPPQPRRSGDDVNGAVGFLAIAILVRYWAANPAELDDGMQAFELKLAGALIGLGALCDVADGIVARVTWCSRLGDHLDGMADAITFGVAPAQLIAVAGLAHPSFTATLFLAAATTHLVAIVVRLARHAAVPHSPADGFIGVTSPLGAVGVIVMATAIAFTCAGVAVLVGLVPLRVACALGLIAIVGFRSRPAWPNPSRVRRPCEADAPAGVEFDHVIAGSCSIAGP